MAFAGCLKNLEATLWVQPMLQKLGNHIANCIARAEECREAAASEPDVRVRSQLLNLETSGSTWQKAMSSSPA